MLVKAAPDVLLMWLLLYLPSSCHYHVDIAKWEKGVIRYKDNDGRMRRWEELSNQSKIIGFSDHDTFYRDKFHMILVASFWYESDIDTCDLIVSISNTRYKTIGVRDWV